MTRERAEDYDDKKRLILRRAAELFATKGFVVTTMIEVAKACNASKSHLYYYFPAKEDLLFAIVEEHTEMLSAELSRIVEQALPADERFEQFLEAFTEIAAEYRNEHLVLTNDLKSLPSVKAKKIRGMEVGLVIMLTNLLEEINPDFASARPDLQRPSALLLFGMIIWTFTWYKQTGSITPKELGELISQLFLNGYRTLKS